jgi:CDP-6-deoxy-D-xylo-4-hexulose-3-dehydrase
MQAACGLAQLEKLPNFVEQRRFNFNYLYEQLKDLEEFFELPKATKNSNPSWFGFPLTLRQSSPFARVDLIEYLTQHAIGTRLLFAGNLTKQPYMSEQNFRISGDLKVTDEIMDNTFWVGVHPSLTADMLSFLVQKISEYTGSRF